MEGFSALEGLEMELAERLVEEGFLSYDDLSIIEPDALMAMGNLSEEEVDKIVSQAEVLAEEAEAAAQEARKRKREEERLAAIEAELAEAEAAAAAEAPADESADEPSAADDAQAETADGMMADASANVAANAEQLRDAEGAEVEATAGASDLDAAAPGADEPAPSDEDSALRGDTA